MRDNVIDMNNIQEFRKVYYECMKQLIDANVDLFRKSNLCEEISFKTELEISLYTFAYVSSNELFISNADNKKILEETMIEILSWMFSQKQYILPNSYFKQRLSDFQSEIDDCSIANTNLPLYSYYSFFKSPLSQFEKEKVNDYDAMELYKFKFFMIQLSEMNTRATEFLLKTLNDILNKN